MEETNIETLNQLLLKKRKCGDDLSGENVETIATNSDHLKRQKYSSAQTFVNCEFGLKAEQDYPDPVTVETSVCDEKGNNLIRHSQINLLSHCVFCLRKTTINGDLPSSSQEIQGDVHSSELPEDVPRARMSDFSSSPHFLSTFNSIWAFLGKGKQTRELNEDPLDLLGEVETVLTNGKEKSRATFLDLPITCSFCAEILMAVHGLFTELRSQLNAIRKIVKESKLCGKYSWRAKQFERVLTTSSLEKGVITATIDILDELGRNLTNEPRHEGQQDNFTLNSTSSPNLGWGTSLSEFQNVHSALAVSAEEAIVSHPTASPKLIAAGSSASGSPFDASSAYVQVPSADKGVSENFVDEDDDWNDNDSDPDYIKSEPDDDFSEEEPSSESEIDAEWEPPRMGSSSKKSTPLASGIPDESKNSRPESSKKVENNKGQVRNIKRRIKRCDPRRQQYEQSGALVVQLDVETGMEKFQCRTDGCGRTYKKIWSFYDHHNRAHEGKTKARSYKTCDECGKQYRESKDLRKHLLKKHGKILVSKPVIRRPVPVTRIQGCDLCKKIVSPKDFLQHVREHVGDEYLLPCPGAHCSLVYSQPYSLYSHLKGSSCPKSIPYVEDCLEKLRSTMDTCEVCGQKGMNRQSLRGHLNRFHENPTKNFSCPINGCRGQFTVRQSVVLHISQHVTSVPCDEQQCDQCSVKISVEQMENHLKETHGVEAETLVKCNRCPFLFSSRDQLIEHLFEHKSGGFSCDICDQLNFSKHVQLREHYMNVHNIGKKIQCEHCEKIFKARYLLLQHKRKEHPLGTGEQNTTNRKKKPINCDLCDFVSYRQRDVFDHKIKFHDNDPYVCAICGETFLTWELHSKHEKEHSGISAMPTLKFKCEVEGCEKTFKTNFHLKRHISLTHLGERPHVCEVCGKGYTTADGLKLHKETFHLGLRKHICETCGDSFTSSGTLKRHALIHTNARPFECTVCNQRFRHKEVLKTHLKGHERKGADFKPNGPMKQIRKRVEKKVTTS